MSGGEKAFTALTLVFAVFLLNPASFCMLDEVNAPLDDASVMFLFGQRPIRLRVNSEVIMNLSTLRKLPIEQRMHLVEELWDSIAADQGALPLTSEQRDELDRRLDAYEVDGNFGRLATEALDAIRKRL